jgi:hypothetical protein
MTDSVTLPAAEDSLPSKPTPTPEALYRRTLDIGYGADAQTRCQLNCKRSRAQHPEPPS